MSGKRRQYILLAVLAVAFIGWLRWGGDGLAVVGPDVATLQPIDAAGLERTLSEINTVNPDLVPPIAGDAGRDRNLFQYGEKPPPPPPPVDPREVERQRVAAQAELQRQEEAARLAKQQQELEEQRMAELRAAEEQRLRDNPPPPPEPAKPVKPPPPTIEFRYVGLFGPKGERIAVLMDGEEPLLVKVGQVVKKDFKVINIGMEWADIGYVNPEYRDVTKRIHLGS